MVSADDLKKLRTERKPFRRILKNIARNQEGVTAITDTKHVYMLKIDSDVQDSTMVSLLGELADVLNKTGDLPKYSIETMRTQDFHVVRLVFPGHSSQTAR